MINNRVNVNEIICAIIFFIIAILLSLNIYIAIVVVCSFMLWILFGLIYPKKNRKIPGE